MAYAQTLLAYLQRHGEIATNDPAAAGLPDLATLQRKVSVLRRRGHKIETVFDPPTGQALAYRIAATDQSDQSCT